MQFHVPGALRRRLLGAVALAACLLSPLGASAQSSGSGLKDGGLDSGEYRTCGIRAAGSVSGTVSCWGDFTSVNQPPLGMFTRISVGFDHTCAINSAGRIVCWGNPTSVGVPPPTGTYIAISSAEADNCAVRADGALRCWGHTLAETMPTTGVFRDVSAYNGRACAIADDGALHCWQSPGIAALGTPPAGRFLEVSMGSDHACGLTVDGRVRCWGSNALGQTDADPDTRFRAVSAGYRFSCAIRADGQPVCWGANDFGQTQPPTARFNAIATGRTHACARDDHGSVHCWGSDSSRGETFEPAYGFELVRPGPGQICNTTSEHALACEGEQNAATPPSGSFVDVGFGSDLDGNGVAACGVRRDGRIECWGKPLGEAPPTDLRFRSVSVGEDHACAVSTEGEMRCWGQGGSGQTTPPSARWTTVTSGRRFSCGQLAVAGFQPYQCWGDAPSLPPLLPYGTGTLYQAHGDNLCGMTADRVYCAGPDSATLNGDPRTFSSFALGRRHVCAIPFNGSPDIFCWGDDSLGQLQAPGRSTTYFEKITAYGDTTCAVHNREYTMDCWGEQTRTVASPTANVFPQRGIAAGTAHTCTLRPDRGPGCWGDDTHGQTQAARGPALALAAGGDHACLLRSDAAPSCWGDDTHGGATPPATRMRAADVGEFNGCGLDDAGEAVCWGWDGNGQSTPPAGAFRSLATGLNHSCGVRDDGTLACWGYDAEGQATPPDGMFREVDVGERHSCAIAASGAMQCWGMNEEGQATPPDLPGATYVALSAGAFHTCAILSHGATVCWGRNDSGQANAPIENRYVAVAAGFAHTCAIRDDGVRECWGENGNGQAPTVSIAPAEIPTMTNTIPVEVDFTLVAEGGYVPPGVRYRMFYGPFPTGVYITGAGQLRGTPKATPGTYSMTVEAIDDNGFTAKRSYTWTVERAPDFTPPVVQPRLGGPLTSGPLREWYSGGLLLEWYVQDDGSPITARVGCERVVFEEDTDLAPYGCSATSEGGTTSVEIMLGRDSVAPDTRLLQVPPAILYTDQYYTNAVITFDSPSADSDRSGLARFECSVLPSQYAPEYRPCTSPFTIEGLTVTTATYAVNVRAVDNAGNADATPAVHLFRVLRDLTTPVVDYTLTGPVGDNGWYVGDVALRWSIEDPETPYTIQSGCIDQVFATDTSGSSASCQVRSLGGFGTNAVYIRRDTMPPVVQAAATTAPNAEGWYRQDVTVRYTCSDSGSQLADPCPFQQLLTAQGAGIASTAQSVRDKAGLVGHANIVRVNIDKTAPVISVTMPPATVLLNATHDLQFSVSDPLSGVLSQGCTAFDTSTVGTRAVTCTATDRAGNTTIRSGTYRVVYGFAATSAPLDQPGITHEIRTPRSVVLEWRLFDAAGAPVTQAKVLSLTYSTTLCTPTVVVLDTPPMNTEQPVFSHLGGGRYRQNMWMNWNGYIECRLLRVVLDDNIARTAIVKVTPFRMRTGGPGPMVRLAGPSQSPPVSRPMAPAAPAASPVHSPVTGGATGRRATGLPAFLLWEPATRAPAQRTRAADAGAAPRPRAGTRAAADTRADHADACMRDPAGDPDTCAREASGDARTARSAAPAASQPRTARKASPASAPAEPAGADPEASRPEASPSEASPSQASPPEADTTSTDAPSVHGLSMETRPVDRQPSAVPPRKGGARTRETAAKTTASPASARRDGPI